MVYLIFGIFGGILFKILVPRVFSEIDLVCFSSGLDSFHVFSPMPPMFCFYFLFNK